MPYGLRIWNASGQLQLDTSTRTARVISRWVLYNPALSNDMENYYVPYDSPAVPELVNDGNWVVWCPAFAHQFEFIGGGRVRFWFFNKYSDDLNVQVTFLRF